MRSLTRREVIGRRLARSHLLEPAPRAQLVDVVRNVGLIQAQVLSAAEIGLAVRVHGITAGDVRRHLYERRTLVKTWSVRGTLHLVPADELPLWAAAVRGDHPYWETQDWLGRQGLTRDRMRDLLAAIADALAGRCLTRAELADGVEERLGWEHERLRSGWGELLHPAAVSGTLCFGPPRGANVTFVRAGDWLGGWRDVDPAQARLEVLRRYLRAHGPAKADDFRRWSGFGRDEVRAAFEALADELEPVRLDRSRLWMLGGDDADLDRDPTGIRLLPRYDAYVLGFRPRELIVPERVKQRISRDPKGRWETVTGMSTLLVDGVVTGLWRRTRTPRGERIEIEQVVPLQRGRSRELKAATDRVREIVTARARSAESVAGRSG